MKLETLVKKYLHYNPGTGIFTCIKRMSQRIPVGCVLGCCDGRGYIQIRLQGTCYKAHRLAFLYMTGKPPPDQIDHINRIRDDNRWCNLRLATRRENNENRINNNKFVGVRWCKQYSKWRAYSSKERGKALYLGRFNTHLAACYARHAHDQLNQKTNVATNTGGG